MDSKSNAPMVMAPGASGAALRCPSPEETRWPRLDDHLVETEVSREEVVRGVRIETMASNPEHGDPHCRLDALLWTHARPGYVGSTDMTSRFAIGSDFAPDTCVRKEGIDPETGTYHLPELAFEVVNEQALGGKTGLNAKAEDMMARGVRRVIAIFVKTQEVKEWRRGAWQSLKVIEDPALASPLSVKALLNAAAADLAVVTALLAKNNPEIDDTVAKLVLAKNNPEIDDTVARLLVSKGNPVLLRQSIRDLCEVLDIPLLATRLAQLERLDAEGLRTLHAHLKSQRAWPA